jgi:pimeloyl-ACP methyl ester carboxylesterase
MMTVYFHGLPGTPAELALLGGAATRDWLAPDRANLPAEPTARFALLAEIVSSASGGKPCRIVGFSAGAHAALRVAALMPTADLTLHLVSPAAPLETGSYLPRMAGGALFSAARDHPRLFPALVLAQSLLARWFPGALLAGLFASARGEDQALVSDPYFANGIREVVRDSLIRGRYAYRAEIAAYVRPWAEILPQVRHPVTIWQGGTDSWTPPDMAEALARALPNVQAHNVFSGLSHYSTLRLALAELTA